MISSTQQNSEANNTLSLRSFKTVFSLPFGFTLGGVEIFSTRVASCLSSTDSVVIIAHDSAIESSENLPPKSVAVRFVRAVRFAPKLRSIFRAYSEMLPAVFVPNAQPGTYATCAEIARLWPEKCRVIGICHSDEDVYYDLLAYYEPMIHRFVAVSSTCAQKLQKKLPEHRSGDIVFRAYGVDLEKIQAKTSRNNQDVEMPLKLVYAGRVESHQKRIFDLIDLFRNLDSLSVNFEMCVAGDGTCLKEFSSQVKALPENVSKRIRITGVISQTELFEIFCSSDVFIQVSAFEGTSLSMLEAMASGCVPLVTSVSGAVDMVKDSKNGYLFQVGDMSGMANKINEISRNRSLLKQLSTNAIAETKSYSLTEYAKWFKTVLSEVSSEAPRPWPFDKPTTKKLVPFPIYFYIFDLLPPSLARVIFRLGKRLKNNFRRT